MSAPVLADAPRVALSADWRRLLPPLGFGLLLLGLLFRSEVTAAVQTWDASTAYNHCFLVIPIALYLLWDRRDDLTGIPAQPMPAALILGIPLAVVWLGAERLGIMEGRQLVVVCFVELLFLAVLGKRLFWAMSGPLLYLFFLVPFGEFLTPRLQDVTTWFVRHGLEILGIPAYIDGYVIEIPQGTFFIAEACAGLRFLIASIAFGVLYALMMYRSPARRGLFVLVSIIVPIIANGFRAIGIVSLGYLLGSAQAAATDHVLYGWLFFSIVILLLIALGLPFRQDEISTRSASSQVTYGNRPAMSLRTLFAVVLGMLVIAAISPTVAAGLAMAKTSVSAPSRIELGAGCVIDTSPADSKSSTGSERARCGGTPMIISWATFSPRSTAGPVMAERRRMVLKAAAAEDFSEKWLDASSGASSAWRIMTTNDPPYAIAVSIWVDGRPVRPGLAMRLRMAWNSLVGSTYAPMLVTVTPAVDWDTHDATELKSAFSGLPVFLLLHSGLDQTVGALTALH